ncbi:MAG: IS66 family insertion sequence element accessory protein TnpB [Ruminococcus sp.]
MSCGMRCSRIKGRLWEDGGFLLVYKRFDNRKVQWSRNETEVLLLTPKQIHWLVESLKIEQLKAIKDAKKCAILMKIAMLLDLFLTVQD